MVENNKHSFYQATEGSIDCAIFSAEQINNVIAEFPFFHSMHLLKAVVLNTTDNDGFDIALPSIAVNVRDRAQLYDLVHKNNFSVLPISEEEIELNETTDIETEKQDSLKELSVESVGEVSEIELNTESQILSVQQSEAIELSQNEKFETVESGDDSTDHEETQEPANFADWLKLKAAKSKVKTEQAAVPVEPVSVVEVELMRESAQTMNHLDRFIVDEIIKKQTKKKRGVSKESKFTETSDLSFVTETLADIFVMQKKYHEAIATYQKLMLKYPQKSSYFATRIEKIKKYE